jgi:MFS family permease
MLTTWFASKERGTYWGLWNIAHNLGGFLAPIVAGTAAGMLGWRWGMWVPGIAGAVLAPESVHDPSRQCAWRAALECRPNAGCPRPHRQAVAPHHIFAALN